jgi:hypothetical protein
LKLSLAEDNSLETKVTTTRNKSGSFSKEPVNTCLPVFSQPPGPSVDQCTVPDPVLFKVKIASLFLSAANVPRLISLGVTDKTGLMLLS